jgi:hypothetical protein
VKNTEKTNYVVTKEEKDGKFKYLRCRPSLWGDFENCEVYGSLNGASRSVSTRVKNNPLEKGIVKIREVVTYLHKLEDER